MKRRLFVCLVLVLVPSFTFAQGTAADYERSANLRRLTQNKVSRERVEATWLADKHRFWYRVDLADGGPSRDLAFSRIAGSARCATPRESDHVR